MANYANAVSGFQTALIQGANLAGKFGGTKRTGEAAYNISIDPPVHLKLSTPVMQPLNSQFNNQGT